MVQTISQNLWLTFLEKTVFPNAIIKPIPNVQEAYVYSDVIKPILQTKCYSCHGVNKQKGKLRMDDSVMLMTAERMVK